MLVFLQGARLRCLLIRRYHHLAYICFYLSDAEFLVPLLSYLIFATNAVATVRSGRSGIHPSSTAEVFIYSTRTVYIQKVYHIVRTVPGVPGYSSWKNSSRHFNQVYGLLSFQQTSAIMELLQTSSCRLRSVMRIKTITLYVLFYLLESRRTQSFTCSIGSNTLFHQRIRRTNWVSPSQRQLSADSIDFFIVINSEDDDENDKVKESELVIDDDDDDDDNVTVDPYLEVASSEFSKNNINVTDSSNLVLSSEMSTSIDWGGALEKLRQRFDDIEQGKSGNPSQALFRLMSAQPPNQVIGSFINSANPQVVQAMSGAVSSLLGGLSSPASGIETIVKATGSKLGNLCFQLQMTGYVRTR
jgi:hypothetical protein